jgi:hypothetical protein
MFEAILFPSAAMLYLCAIIGAFVQNGLRTWAIVMFGTALAIDTSATAFVCIIRTGASLWPNTIHATMGYLALVIMALHFTWALSSKRGGLGQKYFHRWSPVAAVIWFIAFISGIPR